MIIVADSSPIISLAIINHLDLLDKIFDNYFIPEEVYREVTEDDKPYSELLKSFLKNKVKKINNKIALSILTAEVDKGEAEAIVLALENSIENILIDDLKGRKTAQHHGLNTLGTAGLLLQAKRQGLIKTVKGYLDLLLKNDIRISKALYNKVLQIADER